MDITTTKVVEYDNTKLSAWANCRMQGFYAHQYGGTGIIPKEPSVALVFGMAFHSMIEAWCRGESPEASFRKDWERELPVEKRDYLEMTLDRHSWANAERLFKAYIERFPQSLYSTVSVEQPFRVKLGVTDSGVEVYWTGILDRVVRYCGDLYFLELKTTSHRIDERWLRQFQVSGQIRGYIWSCQQLYGTELAGAIIHGVEKAAIPKQPGRARSVGELLGSSFVTVSPMLLEEWQTNVLRTIEGVEQAILDNQYTMNLGDACNAYNFSGCAYRDLCGVDPGMRQQVVEGGYVRRVWNPLSEVRSQRVKE